MAEKKSESASKSEAKTKSTPAEPEVSGVAVVKIIEKTLCGWEEAECEYLAAGRDVAKAITAVRNKKLL